MKASIRLYQQLVAPGRSDIFECIYSWADRCQNIVVNFTEGVPQRIHLDEPRSTPNDTK